ncbi:MAG: type II toxin-antitoxin system RelE/ParE family toxin [Melioribacteraceae bacterium]|nr:type II toxin-antitoxin system RelE/ParE family toxin [Melioribacteraceae bacterium]MCF8393064.1 type II toxin-antitoxin system RelE/ParE family toxin [Melioribacteraceae bacterium]MCF8419182.1 type II toxin-antitoxin system RelE/ParE family toxin [Melioribacteraceae bacterium]
MEWSIKYYSAEVQKKILSLPSGLLARYLRLTDLMLEFGSNLGMPHTKLLEDGLIELRVKSKEGIARVFFCTLIEKRIMMLHSFIPKNSLEINFLPLPLIKCFIKTFYVAGLTPTICKKNILLK